MFNLDDALSDIAHGEHSNGARTCLRRQAKPIASSSSAQVLSGSRPHFALARRGIPNVVLAAEPELVRELHGSTFHPPTLDMLDEFDVVPRMIADGLKAPTWQFRDRETGPVATFDLSLLAGETNHPYRVQCEQWKLMRLLHDEYLEDSRRRDPVWLRGHGCAPCR